MRWIRTGAATTARATVALLLLTRLSAAKEPSTELSRSLDLMFNGGFQWFFEGPDRLRRIKRLPAGTEFGVPGPGFTFAASITLAWYPGGAPDALEQEATE